MAKKTPPILRFPRDKLAAQDVAPAKAVRDAFGVSQLDVAMHKVNEIKKLLWVHEDQGEDIRQTRLVRALELYESLEPADGAEGMLALQMVGTHDAALECLRRAALSNQTFEGRDMALKHAQKLMTLYTQQLATLNKHRGKGQQKVTVEHVNVQAGGQAIVGTVEAGAASPPQSDAAKSVAHDPSPPFEMPAEAVQPQPVKKG